jgi:hypothetical protein
MLIAARSSKDFACWARATVSARSRAHETWRLEDSRDGHAVRARERR